LHSIQQDLSKHLDACEKREERVKRFEEETKLSLRKLTGQALFRSYLGELSSITKSLNKKIDQFDKQYLTLTSTNNNNKKDNNRNNYSIFQQQFGSLSNELKLVAEKLKSAQSAGMTAEKLIAQATNQGMLEARLYMQPKKTSTTASTSAAVASSTLDSNKVSNKSVK
jgi:hypothetical protein